jgi:hypothetical protein
LENIFFFYSMKALHDSVRFLLDAKKLNLTRVMQVAVVRSEGGNQAAEIAGGAAITVTPDNPLRIAQM